MTALTATVVVLAVAVALLSVLVAGLLRSHAEILRSLHELGAGTQADGAGPQLLTIGAPVPRAAPAPSAPAPSAPATTASGVPARAPAAPAAGRAVDVAGVDPAGDAVLLGVVGARHDTVLAFLSSGCATCGPFWSALADPAAAALPDGRRVVVVTKGTEHESPAAVRELAPPTVPVAMSTRAWEDYEVPGSPYFVCVDGETGSVVGEGTAGSWAQVVDLVSRARADARPARPPVVRLPKAAADRDREDRVDADLLAAGIAPGHPSLYRPVTER